MPPNLNAIYQGDCLKTMQSWPDGSVNTCVTSPPYWGLRDYGVGGQLGIEETPEKFVAGMVEVFREVKRVLRDDGTLWLNLGDSYFSTAPGTKNSPGQLGAGSGVKPKDLVGIPWMVAFALRADGWYLRQDIIWHKPNPMPESVSDRCTKAHEYVFLMSKSPKYYFDPLAMREKGVVPAGTKGAKGSVERQGIKGVNARPPEYKVYDGMRNRRDVWVVNTKPFRGAHFATFPEALIEPMILAGCPKGGIVLDPFMGAGTTALVANRTGRRYLGCELNADYIAIAEKRLAAEDPLLGIL